MIVSNDQIGNPLSDGTWTYTWRNGRELATMTSGSTTWTYTYDANGMRTKRTNGSATYTYVYNGSQLSRMTYGSNTLLFTYDATGAPVAVTYNGTVYYYVTNLQGDVVLILDLDGEIVAAYDYDAWGRLLTTTGSMASTLGLHNPLSYRGYVYDRETALYYVCSRYYNPEIGRWINADSAISGTGGDILGYNMFAYCFNNPVNMSDPAGNWPKWIEKTVSWVDNNIIQPVVGFVEDVVEDFNNYDSNNQSENVVFSSNYFSNYKGALVVKTPFDASFSFGIIGLSIYQQNSNTLKHEYGHTVQFEERGLLNYTMDVAIPSVTINILRRHGKLPYSYYGAPWEAEADMFGGVNRTYDNTPWPQGAYNSYWDLIKLF